MDVTNSPNFYVGRSADVGDMLLYGQVVSECHAQNFDDGSVTKDQSGWGFTVNQGATTIDEDNAAYTVSTSSLTMELEAVTHDLRWIASRGDSRTTHVSSSQIQ